MTKPGEYELPLPSELMMSNGEVNCFLLQERTVSAVEKAHAERSCRNCEHSRISPQKNLSVCSRLLIPLNYPLIFKCDEWKSKEADNG